MTDEFTPIPLSILDEEEPTPTQPEPNTEVLDNGEVAGYMTPPGKPAVLGKRVKVKIPTVEGPGGPHEGPGDSAPDKIVEFLAPLDPPKEAPGVLGTALDVGKQAALGVVNAGLKTANMFSVVGGRDGLDENKSLDPETGAGAFARSTTEFVTEMVGVGKLLKTANILQGAGKAVGLARGTVEGTVSSRMLYDASEGRLSNMLVEHPWAANAVTQYLAAKPDDTAADALLKDTLEGIVTGGAFEGFLGALKGMRAARAAATPELAHAAILQTAEELHLLRSSTDNAASQMFSLQSDSINRKVGYHSTTESFDSFERGKPSIYGYGDGAPDGGGIFFADHPDTAKDYLFTLQGANKGRLIKAELDIQNPKIIDMRTSGLPLSETIQKTSLENQRKLLVEAEKAGHDGAILKLDNGQEEYVVFDPKKIKQLESADVKKSHALNTRAKQVALKSKPLMSDDLKKVIVDDLSTGTEGSSRITSGTDFNFDTMEGPDAAKQAINLVSDALAPEIDKMKGGVQTLQQTNELADILGEEPAKLMANLSIDAQGASTMAARVVAGKQLLQSVGRQIANEARIVGLGTATPERLNKLIDTMGNLQTHLKTTITGAARTTSAGRIRTAASFTAEELNLLVASGGDAKAMGRLIQQKTLAGTIIGVHNEVWINALLSAPVSHAKNVAGGLYNTLMQPLNRTVGGALSLDVASAREGISTFVGLWKSQTEALKMAWKAFQTETPVLNPRDAKFETISKAIPGFWGKAVRLPSRFLMAEDEFFQQINYRANLYSKFTREGMDQGLNGADLATHVQSSIERSFLANGQANLDNAITQESKRQAARSTFTEELRPDSYAAEITRFVTTHPEARVVLPFVKTPYNILRQAVQSSGPIGLFTKTVREELAAGGARRAEALGRMGTGSAIGVAAVGYAISGNITGARPKTPDGKVAPMPEGWQPYSIKVGNRYVSYQGLEPISTMIGTVADMVQLSEHVSEDERHGLGSAITMGIVNNLSNKSYLQGLTQLIDVIESDDPNKLESFMRQRAASYIPAISGQTAKAADPLTKQAWDVKEALMLRVPGLSDKVPPMYNLLGKPVEHSKGTFMVNPFSFSDTVPGHVTEELSRLARREGGFELPPKTLDQVKLTHEQYARMMELRGSKTIGGKTLEENVAELVKSDKYQSLGDSIGIYKSAKREFIERRISQYQRQAEIQLQKEVPGLRQAVQQNKLNKKATMANRPDLVKPDATNPINQLLQFVNPQ